MGKSKLLGAKVEDIIFESFGEMAWRQRLSKSELLRTMIRATLEKNGLKIREIKIAKLKKDG